LRSWKDHLKVGNHKSEYQWQIVETLFKTNGHTIPELVRSFGEVVIDFVSNSEDINFSIEYLLEIIKYYAKSLNNAEREELISIIVDNLKSLSDCMLDNGNIIDVWVGAINIFYEFHLFDWQHLNKIKDCEEEQVIAIVTVLVKACNESGSKTIHEELLKVDFMKSNKNIYDSIYEENKMD